MKNFAGGEESGTIQVRVDADLEELMPRFIENRREDVAADASGRSAHWESESILLLTAQASGGGARQRHSHRAKRSGNGGSAADRRRHAGNF